MRFISVFLFYLFLFFTTMKCIARKFVKWSLSCSLYSMCVYRDVIAVSAIVKHNAGNIYTVFEAKCRPEIFVVHLCTNVRELVATVTLYVVYELKNLISNEI